MPLTLEQILAHEECLKQEITEKQSLLEVCQLLRCQMSEGRIAAALPEATASDTSKVSVESTCAPPTPPSPIPARYVHPELAVIFARHGTKGDIVAWAIRQMSDDYSVGDITARLQREGINLSGAEISVVMSRLKGRGEIEEISRGKGRRGSIFRKPENPLSPGETATDQPGGPVPKSD